ncbi:SusC/RagA family TonB-linked outer membrane protein [Bacteroidia bacterium]|nr:SusC/RagA family TonB-linked outer membrane protein [Bacteroidia bacterium]
MENMNYLKNKLIPVKMSSFLRKTLLIKTKSLFFFFFVVLGTQYSFAVEKEKSAYDNQIVSQQQTRTITGTVTDKGTGEALVGVSVIVKEAPSIGISTDENGKFTLSQAPEGSTLVFTFLGFLKQEIRLGSGNNYNVYLEEDIQALEEVIVVGYGSQKKESLSGAITAIRSEEITTTKTENLVTNLQGKMPGLLIRQQSGEPGDFSNLVSIRGYGEPLVVIDGVTRSRDGVSELAQLNSEDVESISILKDASAAIYGMNAANGVIIVTTKKGNAGKAKFSYSGLYGIKMPTGMEFSVDAYTYRVMANEMARNVGSPQPYGDDLLEKYRTNQPGYQDFNGIKEFLYSSVPQQSHNISVRGGSDKVRYFNSFNYSEDKGLMKSDVQYYKRYSFRSNMSADLTKDLTLNTTVSGRVDKRQQPREGFFWNYKTILVNDRGVGWTTMANPNHYSAIQPENKNPMALIDPDADGYQRQENLTGNAQVDLTYKAPFLKGLDFQVLGSYEIRNNNNSQLVRSYQLYDYYTDDPIAMFGSDSYYNRIDLYQKSYMRLMATYATKIGDHGISAMGAMEASSNRFDRLRGDRQYTDIYTHDILNQGSSTTASNEGYRSYGRLAAYLARFNYDYQQKYLLEAVVRYDGSYRYAPSKRWTLFPSVSAGWRISEEKFIKDNLTFINNLKLRLSYGESGRDTGNEFQYVAAYTSSANRGYVFDDGVLTVGMYPPGVVTDQLTWVTSKTSNIGLDFDLWKGKLSGSLDYFQRKNTGMLASRNSTIPNTFGASFPQENINSDMNQGLELGLTHQGKIGNDFQYTVAANVTFARSKRLHAERASFTSQWDRWRNGNEDRYTGRQLIYQYDGRYTNMNQYETAPLLNGGTLGNSMMLPGSYKILDLNGDGRITDLDQLYTHWAYNGGGYTAGTGGDQRINPPLQYGFTLGGQYKSFDITILFQGASLYSLNYRNQDVWGYGRYPTLHERFLDRWHATDPAADPRDPNTQWSAGHYPAIRPYPFNNTTEDFVVDVWRPLATYLRMKNVEVGYNLPKTTLKKIGFGNIRVFVNATNLFTFCNSEIKNADPEKVEADWDVGLNYPIMKAVNFGVNINF